MLVGFESGDVPIGELGTWELLAANLAKGCVMVVREAFDQRKLVVDSTALSLD